MYVGYQYDWMMTAMPDAAEAEATTGLASTDTVPVSALPIAHASALPTGTGPEAAALIFLCREDAPSEKISQHLDQHPNAVNSRDEDGATPLHWMAMHGHLELLTRMEKSHPSLLVSRARSGMQPIHWAITRARREIVEWLVARLGREALDATDSRLTTPTMMAAQYRNHALMSWLLTHGADPTRCDADGDTAMHWASYKDDPRGLATLSELCALDPRVTDNYGSNCLHLAATTGAADAAAWLLRRPEADDLREARDSKGRRPMEVAEARGHRHVRRLIVFGPGAANDPLAFWAEDAGAWWRGAMEQSAIVLEHSAVMFESVISGAGGAAAERAAERDLHRRYPWQQEADAGVEMRPMQRSEEMRPAVEEII